MFAGACEAAPIVIVLDGLDRLSVSNRALIDLGAWLPGIKRPLPKYVKLIVSALSETKLIEALTRQNADGIKFVDIPQLDLDEAGLGLGYKIAELATQRMVESRPEVGSTLNTLPIMRTLALRHRQTIIKMCQNQHHPNPMFISLMIDISCSKPSFVVDAHYFYNVIKKKVFKKNGVQCLINHFFDELEKAHGKKLFSRVVGLLTLARDGLSEAELEDLLSLPENDDVLSEVYEWFTLPELRRIPSVSVSRIIADLTTNQGRYLMRRSCGQGLQTVLTWAHSMFQEVADERYLDQQQKADLHSLMGRYFGNLIDSRVREERLIAAQPMVLSGNKGVWWAERSCINKRRCRMALHHLLQVNLIEAASRELCKMINICGYIKVNEGGSLLSFLVILKEKLTDAGTDSSVSTGVGVAVQDKSMLLEKVNHYYRFLSVEMSCISISSDPSGLLVERCTLTQPTNSLVRQDIEAYLGNTAVRLGGDDGKDIDEHSFASTTWVRGRLLGGCSNFNPVIYCLSNVHTDECKAVAFSPDGSRLASASLDKNVLIWDVHCGEGFYVIANLNKHSQGVVCLSWSPCGSMIASGAKDGCIIIWHVICECVLFTLQNEATMHSAVLSLAWSHRRLSVDGTDAEYVTAGYLDKTVRVWNALKGGAPILSLSGHVGQVNAVAVGSAGAGGGKVASGSADKTIRIWDLDKGGQLIAILQGHLLDVSAVKWSVDGLRLASAGSWDKTVRLWDATTYLFISSLVRVNKNICIKHNLT